MPELPEVETIRRGLEKYLVGKRILEIMVKDSRLVQGDVESLIGAEVLAVKRFGKGLVFELSNGKIIAIHIKLTGQLVYRGEENKHKNFDEKLVGSLPSKFTRVIIKLSPQGILYFNDVRRFAWMKIVDKKDLQKLEFFRNLGPEPFKDLTLEQFKEIIKNSNQKIKALLMDQKKISGVGNIYANEALFEARINPLRKASSLKEKEIEKLYKAVLRVLELGLKYGGTTEVNFVNADGQKGSFQEKLKVYGRKGEPCPVCGRPIKYTKISGRSTFYCPYCQK